MSRGPGSIEKRIADLFAATRDRALTIDDITRAAFELSVITTPTRAQRLSATRAAHRLLRRVRDDHTRMRQSTDEAESAKLYDKCERVGIWTRFIRIEGKRGSFRGETDHWCATSVRGRLYFHPPDVPARIWAVSLGPGGITWSEAEVAEVTKRNVMVRYGGEVARLDRRTLWYWWAFWRGVMFVSSRTGRIAAEIDQLWHRRYGASGNVPPNMQMPLADAIALLGVKTDYTKADVLSAFRRTAKEAHPDAGGTAEMFRKLVEARDRLLAALGTSAPPPKPPSYAPKGVKIVYRSSVGSQQGRLSSNTHLLS
jgi:hypothetical protein